MKILTLFLIFISSSTPYLSAIEFSNRINNGTIEYSELNENSGMVVGIENPDIIWAINDGQANEVYGFDKSGNKISIIKFNKSILETDSDIEDIAISIIDNKSYIILADIGDNGSIRENCNLYLIPEPKSENISTEEKIKNNDITKYVIEYQDGARDAECLLIDPFNNYIYIVTKREENARLYELEYPFNKDKTNILLHKGDFTFGNNPPKGFTGVNGGDISKDGRYILIRDYSNVWHFEKESSESLISILNQPLQRISSYNYSLNEEPQGEAICWNTDNSGFFTASEEKSFENFDASLYYFKSLLSSIKKKELVIKVLDSKIINLMNKKINFSLYNYIGVQLYNSILFPFESFDFTNYKNQAHFLIIKEYNQLFRVN